MQTANGATALFLEVAHRLDGGPGGTARHCATRLMGSAQLTPREGNVHPDDVTLLLRYMRPLIFHSLLTNSNVFPPHKDKVSCSIKFNIDMVSLSIERYNFRKDIKQQRHIFVVVITVLKN